MKILITEDDTDKRTEIVDYVRSSGVDEAEIVTAVDMADFMAKFDDTVSLCIIDLRLPAYDGGSTEQNGIGILQVIEKKGGGRVKLLAISAYPEEFAEIRPQFESRGCLLVDYNQKAVWQSVLKQMIVESQSVEEMDFLIFCALRLERTPYTGMAELNGCAKFRDNLSRFDLTIAGKKGAVIELPRMGLVDAAVAAGSCIEKFKPRVIAMSGICAGFAGRAELGQLLISELAFEYQSGKWTSDGFSQEPYQVPISEDMRTIARGQIEDPDLMRRLEDGWKFERPDKMHEPKLAAFTSGSAVIASEEFIKQVATYHRRVSGLDMEVYAIHRAAHVAHCKPDVICAKTVVDLAGGDKNDKLQPYGCMISARFVVDALTSYFGQRP